jgi:hypothetical protein
VGNLT